MSPIRWMSVALVVAVLCAGCANRSLDAEAEDLRAEVAGLPGVASVRLDYREPITLDSGKLTLAVEMGEAFTADQVVAVTETAYRAFDSTHRGEEANLSISAGRSTVALRAFEPDASVDAVGTAVRTGLAATPDAASVAIDLTTDDVPKGDHVAGSYLVALPEATTYADVPGLLAALAVRQPDNQQIGWGGAAADGSSLSYDSGLPPEELIARWGRMQRADAPLAVRAFEDGVVLAEGRLTRRYDVQDPTDRRALDRITHPQLRALAGGEWSYTLRGPGGADLVDIDRHICGERSLGPYDDELEAWATAEFGPCG